MSEENLNTQPKLEETKTRKTIRLRPLVNPAAGASITPAPAVLPKTTNETATRKTIRLRPLAAPTPAAAPAATDDRTVRIPKPALVVPTPAAAPSTATAKTARLVKPAAADDDRTVKLKRPEVAPAIPSVKVAPAPTMPAPKAPSATAAKVPTISLATPSKANDADIYDEEETPRFNLAIGIAALLLIGAALLITTVHYLSLDHGVEIATYVPGLPTAK